MKRLLTCCLMGILAIACDQSNFSGTSTGKKNKNTGEEAEPAGDDGEPFGEAPGDESDSGGNIDWDVYEPEDVTGMYLACTAALGVLDCQVSGDSAPESFELQSVRSKTDSVVVDQRSVMQLGPSFKATVFLIAKDNPPSEVSIEALIKVGEENTLVAVNEPVAVDLGLQQTTMICKEPADGEFEICLQKLNLREYMVTWTNAVPDTGVEDFAEADPGGLALTGRYSYKAAVAPVPTNQEDCECRCTDAPIPGELKSLDIIGDRVVARLTPEKSSNQRYFCLQIGAYDTTKAEEDNGGKLKASGLLRARY